jgi:hypothetical protein
MTSADDVMVFIVYHRYLSLVMPDACIYAATAEVDSGGPIRTSMNSPDGAEARHCLRCQNMCGNVFVRMRNSSCTEHVQAQQNRLLFFC